MRRRVVVLVACALVALAGCSGSSSNHQPVDARLAAAKKGFDEARFIGFDLSSDNLPDGVTTLESAHGTGTHPPAFTGEVQVNRGFSFSAPVIAVNGQVHAKLPFVGWNTIDPADYGAPDPAELMSPTTGVSSWLTDATHTKVAGTERSGSTVLTKITGTLAGHDVHALFSSAALTPFQMVFTLTDANVLHSVELTGQMYGADHGSSTYTIDLNLAADPVTITPPE